MAQLSGIRVAVIAVDGFEESELTEPVQALKDAGAEVHIVSEKKGKIQAFKHFDKSNLIDVDRSLDEVSADQYEAVVLPGGALNADQGRASPKVLSFVKEIAAAHKPIAAICHAPWILISAGLLKGKKVTAYRTLQDDLKNAGAHWVDQEVVLDNGLVTSRNPGDLPAFNREMIRVFSEKAPKTKRPAA